MNDALSLDVISLSSNPKGNNLNSQTINLVSFPCFGRNVLESNTYDPTRNCRKADSSFKQQNGTTITPEPVLPNTLVTLTEIDVSKKYSNTNVEEKPHPSRLSRVPADSKSSCIWPVGISHQPDFIEIVVTDEEMNAYWDTIRSFF